MCLAPFYVTVVLITHVIWSSLSIFWLHGHYVTCPVAGTAKQVLLGKFFFPYFLTCSASGLESFASI